MRSRSFLDWLPGVAFAALYLATPSRNLDLTHDSVFYLLRISLGTPELDPNHLVFEPMMAAAHRLLSLLLPGIGLERAIQTVQALSGAAALQAGWMTAVHRLGIGRPAAWLATAAAGFTYGVWYYSVTVETYIVPLALLAWSFYVLSSPRAGTGQVIVGAIGHSLATLVHQSAVLFGPAALAALLTVPGVRASRPDLRTGLRRAALYLAICLVLVGGAYIGAAVHTGGARSVTQAVDWMKGHGAEGQFWSAPPRAFVEAAVGFGRATFGGYYAFAIDALRARIEQALPGSYLGDELFLVRNLPQGQAIALVGVTALVGLLMAALAVVAIGRLVRRTYGANTRVLVLLLVWFVAYAGFFTFWDPKNADFWIVPAFLVWYVLAGSVARPEGLSRGTGLALAAAAAGLLVTTGAGIIRLTSDPANDFYTVHLREIPAIVRSSDLLVVGDDWPIARHIGYRLKRRAVYLSIESSTGHSPAQVTDRAAAALRTGHRVFVTDDVLDAKGPSVAVYGEDYAAFVREVASRLCDLRALPAGPYQLQLYEVGCVRTQEAALHAASGEAASGTVQ
ncbi:MAG TPA: hypothetical protein VF198_03185 [Vicinamibacterales bacterium]